LAARRFRARRHLGKTSRRQCGLSRSRRDHWRGRPRVDEGRRRTAARRRRRRREESRVFPGCGPASAARRFTCRHRCPRLVQRRLAARRLEAAAPRRMTAPTPGNRSARWRARPWPGRRRPPRRRPPEPRPQRRLTRPVATVPRVLSFPRTQDRRVRRRHGWMRSSRPEFPHSLGNSAKRRDSDAARRRFPLRGPVMLRRPVISCRQAWLTPAPRSRRRTPLTA
jgi:hypothetical protein